MGNYNRLYGETRRFKKYPKRLKEDKTVDITNKIVFYTKDIFTESLVPGFKITLQIDGKWKYFGPYKTLDEAKIKCMELKLHYDLGVPELLD